jgi:hypothetical protein
MKMSTENRGPTPQTPDPAAMIQTGFDKLGQMFEEAIASRGAPPEPETPETPETPAAAPPDAVLPEPTPAPDVILTPLKTEFDGVRSSVATAVGAMKEQNDKMVEKLIGLEQQIKQNRAPAVITSRNSPALFEALTSSDVYKNELSRGGLGKVENLPSILLEELEMRASTPTTIGSTEVGGMLVPYYRPGIVEYQIERYGLWELMNKMTTDAEKVEIMKESEASGRAAVMNTLEVAIDGDPTAKTTCTLYNSEGFEAGMLVRFHLAASTPTLPLVSKDDATGILTFATDAITFDAAIGTKVTAEAVGATAEEALKPYGYMDVSVTEETLKTLATMLKVTVQRMKLTPMLLQWMQSKLMSAVKRSYSFHCLHGDDSAAGTLAGFLNEVGLQTFTWSTDGVVGDNKIDAILKAIYTLIISDGPIGICMNKAEWINILLLKGTDGHYISKTFGPVAVVDNGPGQRRLGAFPVELDPSCRYTAGTESQVLCADFANAHELYINPKMTSFELGMINDDFELNIRRARYEEMAQNCILSTRNYCLVDLDTAPT